MTDRITQPTPAGDEDVPPVPPVPPVGPTSRRCPLPALRRRCTYFREIRAAVAALLCQDEILSALGYLNGRTRYRFTGIFRFEPPILRNLCLYDRENPSLNLSGGVHPLDDTYCAIVRRSAVPFTTPDAPRDERLRSHRARRTVISYVGVPIRKRDGTLVGVLCHYDVRPRLGPEGEIATLERITPLLAKWLSKAEWLDHAT